MSITQHRKKLGKTTADDVDAGHQPAVAPVPRSYLNSELEEFGKKLEPFYEEKDLPPLGKSPGRHVRVLNIKEAAVKFGAMKKYHHPYLSYAVVAHGKPSPYEIFMDQYDQWCKLKERRAFAKERELEEYDQMAEAVADAARYSPVNLPEDDF